MFSALAVHHLDGAGKRDLFSSASARSWHPPAASCSATSSCPTTRPTSVTPIEEGYDLPDRAADQLEWLRAAGFDPRVTWSWKDCAVIAADAL